MTYSAENVARPLGTVRQARPASGFTVLRSTDPNTDLTPITGGLDEAVEVIADDDAEWDAQAMPPTNPYESATIRRRSSPS